MTQAETYTSKISKNSLWAFISFAVTSICSFIISIELTRLFGKSAYGDYGFFIWLCGILTVAGGFGLGQSLTKFLPELYFNKNPESTSKSKNLLISMLGLQLLLASIVAALAINFLPKISPFINITSGSKSQIITLAALTMLPMSLNAFFAAGYAALQKFARLAKIQITANLINLALVSILFYLQSEISTFFWMFLIFNSGYCLLYFLGIFTYARENFHANIPLKKIIQYSLWNYLTSLANQIVWERSEIFFLAIYSNSSQIGIYSLAYALSILFIGVFATVNTVFNFTASELIATKNQEKLQILTRHSVKYLAMVMFPALIISTFLIKELINLVYGGAFTEAAIIFPILTFAQTLVIVLSPINNIPNLSNEAKKITAITLTTGIVNISLDLLLIPKFSSLGAAIANMSAQCFAVILLLLNIRKYKLAIFTKHLYRIISLNLGLTLIIYTINNFTQNILIKITSALLLIALYIFLIIKTTLTPQDHQILKNLPPKTKKILSFLKW